MVAASFLQADEELARHEVGPKLDWRQEALNMADQLENTHVLVCRLEHQIKVAHRNVFAGILLYCD